MYPWRHFSEVDNKCTVPYFLMYKSAFQDLKISPKVYSWWVKTCDRSTSLLSFSVKGALSQYFEVFWWSTNLASNWRKPENNGLPRWKNTKEAIVNHKGTRMVKDGEDWRRLQTTKLKSLTHLTVTYTL